MGWSPGSEDGRPERKKMKNLNEIIKQNKGGKPYTDGSRWWTLPGVEAFSLSALKNILINLAIMRARLHPIGTETRNGENFSWWISPVEFYFDGLVGEERILLKFTHFSKSWEDSFGQKRVWMDEKRRVEISLWADGNYSVKVNGELQPKVHIIL